MNRANLRVARSGEQVVRAQCAKCHDTGVGGAPRIGDRAAWLPRLKLGLDTLILSAPHVPADAIRRRPKDYPESEYGVAPSAPRQYYVTVALFDPQQWPTN